MADRDTIVVSDSGSGAMGILAVVAIVLLLAVGWFLLFGPGANGGRSGPADRPAPSVEAPAPSA